jgi:hypothetical protein
MDAILTGQKSKYCARGRLSRMGMADPCTFTNSTRIGERVSPAQRTPAPSDPCGPVLCRGTLSHLVRQRSVREHLVRSGRITATRPETDRRDANVSRRRLRCSGRIGRSACTSASRGISGAEACGSDRVRLARSMMGSSRRTRSDRSRSSAVLAQGCTCSDVACACMPPKNPPGATR